MGKDPHRKDHPIPKSSLQGDLGPIHTQATTQPAGKPVSTKGTQEPKPSTLKTGKQPGGTRGSKKG